MCDDEVRVVYLPIERHGSEHQAGESADEEDEEEAANPPHREFEMQTSAPKSRDPAEELNTGGNDDHQAGGGEEAVAHLRESGGKHVVDPHTEADETSGNGSENQAEI